MANVATTTIETTDIWQAAKDILATLEREREREIVARRYGLYDRKETLEEIGELLGITRERVRQLEKAVVARLKAAADDGLPHMRNVETTVVTYLDKNGHVSRVKELAVKVGNDKGARDEAHVAFLSELAPALAVLEENDDFYHSVGNAAKHDNQVIKDQVKTIVDIIKANGKPMTIDKVAAQLDSSDVAHVEALARTSKQLAELRGQWGLTKWPTVNPKNIRDKIYVVLKDKNEPMHFSDIANAIQSSDFRRKDVTVQAIHNELIKDSRFVLIGRGIYALKEWGYKKGTVADIIAEILKKEGGPLHRDEIVKRVLKLRQVKETTILLNLQGKSQFKRVAKATYALA